MSDLIIDFDNHIKNHKVYLVKVIMPLQDAPNDVPSSITADVYVVANSSHQAVYIARCMYPDSLGEDTNDKPITEFEYAARRNRSIL